MSKYMLLTPSASANQLYLQCRRARTPRDARVTPTSRDARPNYVRCSLLPAAMSSPFFFPPPRTSPALLPLHFPFPFPIHYAAMTTTTTADYKLREVQVNEAVWEGCDSD